MDKKIINIHNFISSAMAISPEDGEKLFEEICKALRGNYQVELDFIGIDILVSAFLNSSIGKLYGIEFKDAFEKQQIIISNISAQDHATLKLVQKRAKDFFANRK